MAADAGRTRIVSTGEHGGGDMGGGDSPVAFQGTGEQDVNGFNNDLAEPFGGAGFGALTEEETGLEDVEPIEAEGFEVAFGLRFYTQVEVRGVEVSRNGRDEKEMAGAVLLRPIGKGEDVAVVDGAEGFLGAGFANGGAEAAEGDIDGKGLGGGQGLEIDDALLEAGMGTMHGFAENGEDRIEGVIVEQAVQQMLAGETGGSGNGRGAHVDILTRRTTFPGVAAST